MQQQRQSGIQLTSDEIKLKVLTKIDEIFRTQEKILLHTTIGFDFEQAIKDVNKAQALFGATKTHRVVTKHSEWPEFDALKYQHLEKFE